MTHSDQPEATVAPNDTHDQDSDPTTETSGASAPEPTDDPFADGHGLVGGFGEKRTLRSRMPPIDHRWVLAPWDRPEDFESGRTFFADGPVEVEIGFARGHFLRDRVRQAPDHRFLGFEIKRQWVTRMARFLDREGLEHTRVILGDARPLLLRLLPEGGVHAFYVFFPDPWWKKRHHKRRVVSPATVEVMHRLLAPGGALEIRTDVEDYAEMAQSVLDAHGGFTSVTAGIDAAGRPLPLTHREKKCAENGAPIFRIRVVRS